MPKQWPMHDRGCLDLVHADQSGASGFLADELHWPSPKSLTPGLGFGFAVDGGGCVIEKISQLRSIPKKCHCGQAVTETEGGFLETVTLSGIVMLVRLQQPKNAPSPMLVTALPSMMSGITSSPAAP